MDGEIAGEGGRELNGIHLTSSFSIQKYPFNWQYLKDNCYQYTQDKIQNQPNQFPTKVIRHKTRTSHHHPYPQEQQPKIN